MIQLAGSSGTVFENCTKSLNFASEASNFSRHKTILFFSKKMIFFSDFQAQCSGCMYERSSQEKCDARGIFIHHYHSA